MVIPCGGVKLPHRAPAAELYTGPYFRACLRYAELRAPRAGAVLILSALHGFVRTTQELAPYEQRMGDPGSVSVDVLRSQARDMGVLELSPVEILGGRAYRLAALAVWPGAVAPVPRGLGIGKQLQWLRDAAQLEARQLGLAL